MKRAKEGWVSICTRYGARVGTFVSHLGQKCVLLGPCGCGVLLVGVLEDNGRDLEAWGTV